MSVVCPHNFVRVQRVVIEKEVVILKKKTGNIVTLPNYFIHR